MTDEDDRLACEEAADMVIRWLASEQPERRVLALAVGIMLECELHGPHSDAVAQGVAYSIGLRERSAG